MLVRLMYASRSTAATVDGDLAAILKSSREHNPAEGITGLLCFTDGVFVQVLEGGRNAVNARYKRIVEDPRHRDVILLAYEEIAERAFAGWTMGQVNLHRLNPALLLKYSETGKLDPYTISGAAMGSLFSEMCAAGAIAAS
ncbi:MULTISPECIES: BLUF domain-containing protein [unclassified Roseateles]|uniref:BLUF domain-containing protein n=1 Tax=unclassified Roseateles TaxID=2626991 RepID=UPI0006F743D8|nr:MULTISPECIES: BLUF domain-containing protein [unclassified Roseateles]KQW45808.1 blue light sensor protein [Pelomonas sp. Root405]KRA72652.1 blue light sensor protein [Pelomonas sp. Root662]